MSVGLVTFSIPSDEFCALIVDLRMTIKKSTGTLYSEYHVLHRSEQEIGSTQRFSIR
jgi:hypothetical protein